MDVVHFFPHWFSVFIISFPLLFQFSFAPPSSFKMWSLCHWFFSYNLSFLSFIIFPLSTVSAASHKIDRLYFHRYPVSNVSWFSLWFFPWAYQLYILVLILYKNYFKIFFVLTENLVSLWSQNTFCRSSADLHLLRLAL